MQFHHKFRSGLLAVLAFTAVQLSCKKSDGYNDIISDDPTKPGVISNIKVTNFNGGAHITYSLPESQNLLYVQAEYRINETTTRQTKASYYSDTITVSGFAESKDYQVTLYAVSRSNVRSDSVLVTVHPDTPPYKVASPTVEMRNDFGGVEIKVINDLKADIGVITITEDPITRQMEIVSQNYTNEDTIIFSLRGYDTIPRQFGVYITDKWNNVSDTTFATITPIYETLMNKGLFREYRLPNDAETGFGWVMSNMWDGKDGSTTGYHTEQPIQPLVWPAVITFDMGQSAKLSRYTIWNRGIDISGTWLWQAGAPQEWVMWGRADQPVDETMPDEANRPPVGGSTPNGWINLGVFRAYDKPSGLPNPAYTNADLAFWNAGFSYNLSLSLPRVRYIRFECLSNMALTNNFFNIAELSFWGDDR